MTRVALPMLCLLQLLGPCSCRTEGEPCRCAGRILRISTTTSVDNTGLLGAILPPFEERTGIRVQVLAVGTGQALKLAEMGDVDAVFVHDPVAEEAFVSSGHGIHRLRVMHNDLVIAGPPEDPAGARGKDTVSALKLISASGAVFVSRGDQSGTHKAELRLWELAEVDPRGNWHLESGLNQRLSLNVAHEKRAYTLTDRATYLTAQDRVDLEILVEGGPELHNPYSFIPLNPTRHPQASFTEAMALAGYLTSAQGQRLIGEFKDKGRVLFLPDALKPR